MTSSGDGFPQEPPIGPVRLRLTRALVEEMLTDLRRPHPFAAERIGWMSGTTGRIEGDGWVVLGREYESVPDEHYVFDPSVCARIGTEGIRTTVRRVFTTQCGLFHVHLHDFPGETDFSRQDRADQPSLVTSWAHANPNMPHGMLVLSQTSAAAWVWLPGAVGPVRPEQIAIVGYPLTLIVPHDDDIDEERAVEREGVTDADSGTRVIAGTSASAVRAATPVVATHSADRFVRQAFLGAHAQAVLDRARIGIAGLGGGGSHLFQQLAHIGVRNVRAFDADSVEESNLNRLVGARADDVSAKTPKIEVARRLLLGVLADAEPVLVGTRWQEQAALLRGCDLVFGSVDTFAGRHELEVACRRYGIPYLDIGMDVHEASGEPPQMGGQVILSMPGGPCMWCLGFLSDEKLAREAGRYGAAGGRPQVIWPNGALASTAIGIAMDLLTGWTGRRDPLVYLSYDGNTGELRPHPRLQVLGRRPCSHYPPTPTGDPVWRRIGKARDAV